MDLSSPDVISKMAAQLYRDAQQAADRTESTAPPNVSAVERGVDAVHSVGPASAGLIRDVDGSAPSALTHAAARRFAERIRGSSPPSGPALPVSVPVAGLRSPEYSSHIGASVSPSAESASALKRFVASIRHGLPLDSPCPARPNPTVSDFHTAGTPPHRLPSVDQLRAQFPALHQKIHGHPLAWFDNAATTQKPRAVIQALVDFYERDNSNIHRAAHSLAARATTHYETARQTVARFLGARSENEIVFVRGTTEAINLAAFSLGAAALKAGDEILLTELEHHANIVPWQMIAKTYGAVIRVAPLDEVGAVDLAGFSRQISPRTRIVAISHASNSLGSLQPVHAMTAMSKAVGAFVLIDGAQSVSHMPVDVRSIGCDFYAFSGHKVFGPTGIGALYIASELHDMLPPWQGGGNMIRDVTFAATQYADAPAKFEAGTPNVADAVGLSRAIDFVMSLGLDLIGRREHELLQHATEGLRRIQGVRLVGQAREKVAVQSFVIPGLSPTTIAEHLDRAGIAVRAGHHCAQPSLRRFGLEATVRPSFAFYNTQEEIDRMLDVVSALARQTR